MTVVLCITFMGVISGARGDINSRLHKQQSRVRFRTKPAVRITVVGDKAGHKTNTNTT